MRSGGGGVSERVREWATNRLGWCCNANWIVSNPNWFALFFCILIFECFVCARFWQQHSTHTDRAGVNSIDLNIHASHQRHVCCFSKHPAGVQVDLLTQLSLCRVFETSHVYPVKLLINSIRTHERLVALLLNVECVWGLKNQPKKRNAKKNKVSRLAHEFKLTRWKWKEIKKIKYYFRWFILLIPWDHLSLTFSLFASRERWFAGMNLFQFLLLIMACLSYFLCECERLSLSSSLDLTILCTQHFCFVFRESLPLLIVHPRLNNFNLPPITYHISVLKCYPTTQPLRNDEHEKFTLNHTFIYF